MAGQGDAESMPFFKKDRAQTEYLLLGKNLASLERDLDDEIAGIQSLLKEVNLSLNELIYSKKEGIPTQGYLISIIESTKKIIDLMCDFCKDTKSEFNKSNLSISEDFQKLDHTTKYSIYDYNDLINKLAWRRMLDRVQYELSQLTKKLGEAKREKMRTEAGKIHSQYRCCALL